VNWTGLKEEERRRRGRVTVIKGSFLLLLLGPTACTSQIKSFVFSIIKLSQLFDEYHTAFKVERTR